jgi:hypothetical protein
MPRGDTSTACDRCAKLLNDRFEEGYAQGFKAGLLRAAEITLGILCRATCEPECCRDKIAQAIKKEAGI